MFVEESSCEESFSGGEWCLKECEVVEGKKRRPSFLFYFIYPNMNRINKNTEKFSSYFSLVRISEANSPRRNIAFFQPVVFGAFLALQRLPSEDGIFSSWYQPLSPADIRSSQLAVRIKSFKIMKGFGVCLFLFCF